VGGVLNNRKGLAPYTNRVEIPLLHPADAKKKKPSLASQSAHEFPSKYV
jgi:hypothetical protein